jgi:hypothetical protein
MAVIAGLQGLATVAAGMRRGAVAAPDMPALQTRGIPHV